MARAKRAGGTGAGGNRSDRPSALPAEVVPSKQYGQAAQELAQQRTIPMASGDITPAGGPPAAPQPGTGGGEALGAPPMAPGDLPALDAPTNRPQEPLTHGLPTGPGAGPEALQPPDPRIGVAAVLNQLGAGADPQTKRLRAVLNAQLHNAQGE